MPRLKPPVSLKEQCVHSIVKHMDSYWCKDYIHNWLDEKRRYLFVIGPFEDLPSSLIELIIEELNTSGKLQKHHLHLLLLYQLERLVLSRCTSEFGFIISLLAVRCKKLRHLGLKGRTLPRQTLNEVFRSLSLLQTVDLSQTNVTDQTISVIASSCKHIRVLNLSDTRVTDMGISSLCHGVMSADINPKEKPDISKSLIKLDLYGTAVTYKGIQCALVNMPNLQEVTHSALLYAVAKLKASRDTMTELAQVSGGSLPELGPLQLRFLQSDEFGSGRLGEYGDAQLISPAINLCPNIQYVHLRDLGNVEPDSLLPLSTLNNVIDLVLQFDEYDLVDFFLQILPLLQKHGETLRNLQLQFVNNINIVVIAYLCPELQVLGIHGVNSCTCDAAKYFSTPQNIKPRLCHLKSVNIHNSQEEMDFQLPAESLKVMLGSPLLEKIVIVAQDNLTDEILIEIAHTSKLPNLKILSLTMCNNITIESIRNVIRLNNPLETLNIIYCQKITIDNFHKLQKYIKIRRLPVELSWS
ncbi:uncharacterized protein LOC121879909 isoform X2 [Homarus americanus]|nr:uncharacterized protein LOC121879909 isoform X2 [Homarus americanus]